MNGGRPGLGQPARFLARGSYRRARLEDAARLLPILGLFLFFSPVAIQSTTATDEGGAGTAGWLVFFMAAWLLLIGLAFVLSRSLGHPPTDAGAAEADAGDTR